MKNVNGNVVERLEEALEVLKKLEAKEIEEFNFSKLGFSFKYKEYEIERNPEYLDSNDDYFMYFRLPYKFVTTSKVKYDLWLIKDIRKEILIILNQKKTKETGKLIIKLKDYYEIKYPKNYYLVSNYYLEDLFKNHFSDLSSILNDFDIDLEYEYENFKDYEGEDKDAAFISYLRNVLIDKYNEEVEERKEIADYCDFFTSFNAGYYKVKNDYFSDFNFDLDYIDSDVLEDLINQNNLKGFEELKKNQKESNYLLVDDIFYNRKKLEKIVENEIFLDYSVVGIRNEDLLDYYTVILDELTK